MCICSRSTGAASAARVFTLVNDDHELKWGIRGALDLPKTCALAHTGIGALCRKQCRLHQRLQGALLPAVLGWLVHKDGLGAARQEQLTVT